MADANKKQTVTAAALALGLGFAVGSSLSPDAAPRPVPIAEVAASIDSPEASRLDVAEYNRVVTAARARRPDIVDLLTADVAPGDEVTASVNLDLGTRPRDVEYFGSAAGNFTTVSLDFEDHAEATLIILRARNTSSQALRLKALLQFDEPGEDGR